MADGDLQNNLNEISTNLIQLQVSRVLSRLNVNQEEAPVNQLSDEEREQIKQSIETLKEQTESFLDDQQNENNVAPQTETLIDHLRKLQQDQNED